MEHELHQKPVQREKQCFRKRELPCLEASYQVLKVVERVTKKLIRDCINIDNIQFGFITVGGATGAIFIVRQNSKLKVVYIKVCLDSTTLYFCS